VPTNVKTLDQAAAAAVEAMRTPPHSLEAEQAVLGGLMLDNSAWERVADRIREEDYYRQDHRLIFQAMTELADQDQPFDAVTLAEWLQARGKLEQAGGLAYLATLARDTPTAANVRAYADIVRERSVLRQLIRVGGELAESAPRAAASLNSWMRRSAPYSRSPSAATGPARTTCASTTSWPKLWTGSTPWCTPTAT